MELARLWIWIRYCRSRLSDVRIFDYWNALLVHRDIVLLSDAETADSSPADKRADFNYKADGQLDQIKRYSDVSGTQLVAQSNYADGETIAFTLTVKAVGLRRIKCGRTLDFGDEIWASPGSDAAARIRPAARPQATGKVPETFTIKATVDHALYCNTRSVWNCFLSNCYKSISSGLFWECCDV